MRELRRSFGVLGEAQWFWGLGGVGGGGWFKKTASSWNSDPFSITGALFRSSDSIGRCELQKMEHSNLGLRRDGAIEYK